MSLERHVKTYIVKVDCWDGVPWDYVYNNLADAESKYQSIGNQPYKSLCVEDENGNRLIKSETTENNFYLQN